MLRRARFTTVLTIMVLLLLGYDVASAAKASKISLRDGTVYEDVAYRLDNTYKIVIIRMGFSKKNVSFTNIYQILDADGTDITADCLGDYYRAPETRADTWDSFETPTGEPGRKKKPFELAFRVGTNVSNPLGDWFYATNPGVGFGGELIIAVDRNMAARLTISQSGISHDINELLPNVTVLDDNLSFHVWRYFVSVQTFNWPRWRGNGRTMYYAFVGIGAVGHSLTGAAWVVDQEDYLWEFRGTGESELKFATTYGGGLVHMMSRTIGLEVDAVLDMVHGGRNSSDGYLFDLRVGLVFIVR